MALAVPADGARGPEPDELRVLSAAGVQASRADLPRLTQAWNAYRSRGVPPRIAHEMEGALARLHNGLRAHNHHARAAAAALDVAQSALDLSLRYRRPVDVDADRFALWTRRVGIDAAAHDSSAVKGDVSALEWISQRFVASLDPVRRARLTFELRMLRSAAGDDDFRAAATRADRLRAALGA
jgi:hypothetical protein